MTLRGRSKACRAALPEARERWRSRELRYRPLTRKRHLEPLSLLVTQLRLSIARSRRQIDASLDFVEASNAHIDEVQRLAGIARRWGNKPVSIEAMNAAIADAGAAAGGASVKRPRQHWPQRPLPTNAEEQEWLDMPAVGMEILPDDDWVSRCEPPAEEDENVEEQPPSPDTSKD